MAKIPFGSEGQYFIEGEDSGNPGKVLLRNPDGSAYGLIDKPSSASLAGSQTDQYALQQERFKQQGLNSYGQKPSDLAPALPSPLTPEQSAIQQSKFNPKGPTQYLGTLPSRQGQPIADFTKAIDQQLQGILGRIQTEGVTSGGKTVIPPGVQAQTPEGRFTGSQIAPSTQTPVVGQPEAPTTPTTTPTTSFQAPVSTPPVQTSGQARQQAIAARQKEIEAQTGARPIAPDIFTEADVGRLNVARQERGTIETELTSIMEERLKADEELRKFKSGLVGLPEGGRIGATQEEERKVQERLDALNRRELVLETKLRNRNTVISELMGAQRQEYADAVLQYNTQFSQAIQLYNLFDKEQDEAKQNAKANLDIYSNSIKAQIESGQIIPNQINGVQKAKIEEMEMQAGLPSGSTIAVLNTLKPGEEKLYSGVDDNGNFVYIAKNAKNEIVTRKAEGVATPKTKNVLTGSQLQTAIDRVSDDYRQDPIVKQYTTAGPGWSFLSSIDPNTKNPSDNIGAIYAFAKIMDPESVVREGEYATVQKYAQSWADTFGFNAKRIFSNTNFLSSQAIKNMQATAGAKFKALETAHINAKNIYEKRFNDLKSGEITGGIPEYGSFEQTTNKSSFNLPHASTSKEKSSVLDKIVEGGVSEVPTVEQKPASFFDSFLRVFGIGK